MKQRLSKALLAALPFVRVIYMLGFVISFFCFSWQYARANGFLRWLALGEVVPALKSTIWPYYAAKHFIYQSGGEAGSGQPEGVLLPPDGQLVDFFKKEAWWIGEYREFNVLLNSKGGRITASCRTGPEGKGMLNYEIRRGPGQGMTLLIDAPPESVGVPDEKTGRVIRTNNRVLFTLRDLDLDGMPDQVRLDPGSMLNTKGATTEDGFIGIRDSADHTVFLALWDGALSYCTSEMLHAQHRPIP